MGQNERYCARAEGSPVGGGGAGRVQPRGRAARAMHGHRSEFAIEPVRRLTQARAKSLQNSPARYIHDSPCFNIFRRARALM